MANQDPYSGYDIAALQNAAGGDDWWAEQKAKGDVSASGPEYTRKAMLASKGEQVWPKGSTLPQAADAPLPDPRLAAAREDQLQEAKKWEDAGEKYKKQQAGALDAARADQATEAGAWDSAEKNNRAQTALNDTLTNPKTAKLFNDYRAGRENREDTGLVQPGNVDLNSRPVVKNSDGSISTVRSISFNEDGKEILIPTISPDGKTLSNKEAIELYHQTGQNLGIFTDPESANNYAEQLHQQQATQYALPDVAPTPFGQAHEHIANTVLSAPLTPQKVQAYAGEKYDPKKPFGNILSDYNEQIAAMGQERDDTTALSQQNVKSSENLDAAAMQRAKEGEARAEAVYKEGQAIRDKGARIVDAVLKYQFDPWKGVSGGTEFAAAILGIIGHDPGLGVRLINKRVAQNIAQQQQDVEQLKWAAGQTENLYNLFLNGSKTREQAYDKTAAVMTDIAVHQAEREALPYKDSIHRDQVNQFIALAKQQRDVAYLRAASHAASGGGGGAANQPPFIPLEKGVGTVTLRDGTELLVQKDATKVAEAVTNSERAIEAAQDFANFIADPKTGKTTAPFPTNYQAYQNWVAEAREKMKTLVVLASQHSGTGSQGNIARMKRYQEALAGPDADPKGQIGAVLDYPKLIAGQSQAIAAAARDLAGSMNEDMHSVLQTHGAIVGKKTVVPASGKGKAHGESREVFVPGAPQNPEPKPPEQSAGGAQGPTPNPGAGVPGTTRAQNEWRNYLKPAK